MSIFPKGGTMTAETFALAIGLLAGAAIGSIVTGLGVMR